MNASDLCRQWIQHCEGKAYKAYPDAGGWSIGVGHHGPDVYEGLTWTDAQIDAQFEKDLAVDEQMVNSLVVVPLTQGQFDALCDFVHNEGGGRLQTSTLLHKLNVMKDYAGACRELYYLDSEGNPHGWIYADGEINKGLIARRIGEQKLWNGENPLEGM